MKILEARQIAVSQGISFEAAQKIVDDAPGKVGYWVYHHCEDAPICSADHTDRIPELLWNQDSEQYECSECQSEVTLEDLVFSPPFKVTP